MNLTRCQHLKESFEKRFDIAYILAKKGQPYSDFSELIRDELFLHECGILHNIIKKIFD